MTSTSGAFDEKETSFKARLRAPCVALLELVRQRFWKSNRLDVCLFVRTVVPRPVTSLLKNLRT